MDVIYDKDRGRTCYVLNHTFERDLIIDGLKTYKEITLNNKLLPKSYASEVVETINGMLRTMDPYTIRFDAMYKQ